MNIGYIYIRTNKYWDLYNACKLGKTFSIPDREQTYITSEIEKGSYIMIIEIDLLILDNVEKQLQIYFNQLNLHIIFNAGIEFYKKEIKHLIIPYLDENNIKYRILSKDEIDCLIRKIKIYYNNDTINDNDINDFNDNNDNYINYNNDINDKDNNINDINDNDINDNDINDINDNDINDNDINDNISYNKNVEYIEKKIENIELNNKIYNPRNYQEIIIKKSYEYFQMYGKGLLIIPCGVGKTLISLWIAQKLNSNTILIGVPNKLLLKQWEEVICVLFQNIPYLIVSGGLEIKNIMRFLENNKKKCIIITTYSSAHKIYTATQNIKFIFGMKINDECFPFETGIQTDRGVIKIGELYNMFDKKEKLPLILSFNENNKKFEYKKLTYAWRKECKNLLKIEMSKKIIKCTENHLILTNNGYIKAINLKKNDLIISKYDINNIDSIEAPCLNNDQLQLIYGSYLGDGYLSYTSNKRLKLKIIHYEKQKEYCLWKANILNINKLTFIHYEKKPAYFFESKIFDLDDEIPKNTKIVPNWLLDKIDEKGIAIWFMDNGSVSTYDNNDISSITIHSNNYDEETHIKFINKFKNYNIECSYSKEKEKYYCLKFNKVNSLKLLNLITSYVHSDFNYKISNIYSYKYVWNNKFLEYGTLKITKITNIINNTSNFCYYYVYDIEVEDNHNFIIGTIIDKNNNKLKYIDGPIVHNCHHLTTSNMRLSHTTKKYIQMLNIPSVKQLSLTATLKQIENICDNNIVVSNDNVEYFGEIIDKKCLLWAINENIICDYVIQTIVTNEEQLEEQLLKFHIIEKNDKRLFLSAFASLKSIFDGHSHHLLIYSNNKDNSLKLIQYIKMLLDDNYFDIPDLYYSNYHGEMKLKNQKEIINNFEKTKFGIISCVYCLAEGYDNQNIDAVVFAENMTSNIRIVQSALRASRKNKDKPNKITKIILPILNKNDLFENKNNLESEENNNHDLKKVKDVIYQMGLEDETITQKIKVLNIEVNKHTISINKINIDNIHNFGDYDEELTTKLKLLTIKRTTLRTSYQKARKIIADKNIKSKESYYELCERDNRLSIEPELTYNGQFTNWIEYLSIERIYYDLETCIKKVNELLILHSEIKINYLDLSIICKKLCELDDNFPPNGLWVEYYNVKDLRKIIIINKKKKMGYLTDAII